MSHPAYFFGYGSLVNRHTHDYTDLRPAKLRGWRREWRQTTLRPVAYLTAVPDGNSEIDGLIASVPAEGWAALDVRERAYDRVQAHHQISHDLTVDAQIVVYSIPDHMKAAPGASGRVLLSYIDVVTQGYLREFGEAAARGFFLTTGGWDVTVLNDRATPIYPRHQALSSKEQGLVDEMLREVRAQVVEELPGDKDGTWSSP